MFEHWTDALIHLTVGYPVYQLLGTIRHEVSHVVAYMLAGYGVAEFRILPHRSEDGTFYWGRAVPEVKPGAQQTMAMHMAPYYTNAVLMVAWCVLQWFLPKPSEVNRLDLNLLIALAMMMCVSPVVDTAYNFLKYVCKGRGDFARANDFALLH